MPGYQPAHAAIALLAALAACGIAPSDPSGLAGAEVAASPASTPPPAVAQALTPPVTTLPPAVAQAPTPVGPAQPPAPKAAPKLPPKPVASAPAAKAPVAPKPVASPVAATPAPPRTAAAPALDLKSLEQRIKETDAIGLLTKLSIKNQVDDLVGQFRTYHDGRRPPTLTELRRPFDMLLMKLLALLQEKDPGLANALHESRDAIWGILSDHDRFSQHV